MSDGEEDVKMNGSAENGHSNGDVNGHSKHHKHKKDSKDREHRRETEEERRIRKEKEREDRHKKEGRRPETEEERRIRKDKEREERHKKEGRKEETEEERKIRKDKERKEREERHKKEGRRTETEEERAIRKEKERKEREERHKKDGKRTETEEERAARKEKERKERDDRHKKDGRREETEEERQKRKDKERRERKEKEKIKEEEVEEVKEEPDEEGDAQEEDNNGDMDYEEEVKEEPQSEEEEVPVKKSRGSKRKSYADDEDEDYDEKPKKKAKKEKKVKKEPEWEEEEDFKPAKKNKKAPPPPPTPTKSPQKGKKGAKAEKEEPVVWKWWEEEKKDDGTKWKFLQHRGPLFAPEYERMPKHVRFYYDGNALKLSKDAEEIATFYGRMLDHDYTTKEVFNKNFFKDWRKYGMTEDEREYIRNLHMCDFTEINEYFKKVSEERKGRSKEEKKAEKEKNEAIQKEYGFCMIDGHEEKIGNYRIEPPGLFRGRGEHPKQGMLKTRVNPEDVTINCSKDSEVPEPPEGHKWKEVKHDNSVTWLASWTENVQNQIKYVMLNPSSKLKGEKDMMKYEKARQLKEKIGQIREDYEKDLKSGEMRLRQRAVALYFIDKLALRAGNEKDEDQADTVGCCSLRVEHISLHEEKDGKQHVVEFDFLGKDSIRYHNLVGVEKKVWKNVARFMENKKPGDDLFDRLNTTTLNEYLNGLMPGLTAKVFRTYNASITLQEQLNELTDADDNMVAKVLSYNRANRAVAVLCNHQRAVPKTHEKSMENLNLKIDQKKDAVDKAEKDFKAAKKAYKGGSGDKGTMEKKKKAVERLMEQLNKLETQQVDKEENKTIALGTSKLNYLDPRISVAWCKKYDVGIEKVYNKTQREKFRWAIEMAGPDFIF